MGGSQQSNGGNGGLRSWAIIIVLIGQTATIAYWAGTNRAELVSLKAEVQSMNCKLEKHVESPQYTKEQSDERFALRDQRLQVHEQRMDHQDLRLNGLDGRVGTLEKSAPR